MPKKSTKATPGATPTKEKIPYKPPKREKEKKEPDKPNNKSNLKSKSSQGIKRGPITVEEAGNARRKVRKKEGVKDVSPSVEGSILATTAKKLDTKVSSRQVMNTQNLECEDVSNNLLSIENKSNIRNSFTQENESKCDVNFRTENTCSKSIQDKKESQSSDADISFNEENEIGCDRRLEESLYTGEVCLSTAVIEEVVPDYNISNFQLSHCNENSVSCNKDSLVHTDVSENDNTYKQTNVLDGDSNVALEDKSKQTNSFTEDVNSFEGSATDNLSSEKDLCMDQDEMPTCTEEVLVSTKCAELQDVESEKGFTSQHSYRDPMHNKHKLELNLMTVKPTNQFGTDKELDTVSGTVVDTVEKVPVSHSRVKEGTETEKCKGKSGVPGAMSVAVERDGSAETIASMALQVDPVSARETIEKVVKADKVGNGQTIKAVTRKNNTDIREVTGAVMKKADGDSGIEEHVEAVMSKSDESRVTVDTTVMHDDNGSKTIGMLGSAIMKTGSGKAKLGDLMAGTKTRKGGVGGRAEKTSGTVMEEKTEGQKGDSMEVVIIKAKKNSGTGAVVMTDGDGRGKTMKVSGVKTTGHGVDESNGRGKPTELIVMEADNGGGVLGAVTVEEGSSQEDHVSLSVALAQLVDDGGCDLTEGSETVTIHSALPGLQAEEKSAQEIISLEVNTSAKGMYILLFSLRLNPMKPPWFSLLFLLISESPA